ncbi:hypothetical protein BD324DRAFT_610773 [Kockovaella imperatae]|uniref:Uncharacterized protein n=1 Tax=Kockovaella imperatae TaxID=4999 RepID=A0A1Y1USQ3_9TREE|nr:hypothetical protein BD324DRAFT_610773 [Kockovaella imperatae]ORX40456.1 hypothetical protein BD324DRAFT_610773 [Kockovaella imperatae]
MSAFLGGADCGPVNPLKNVTGRLDVDRSLFQDRLVSKPNIAGPSRDVTNSQSPFDLSELRTHLVPAAAPIGLQLRPAVSDWAQSFVPSARAAGKQREVIGWEREFNTREHEPRQDGFQGPRQLLPRQIERTPWQPMLNRPYIVPTQETQEPTQEPTRPAPLPREPLDDAQEILARTAQAFVADADQSSLLRDNPKLAQSRFMELVNAVAKKDVVVQAPPVQSFDQVGPGATFVERPVASNWASEFSPAPARSVHFEKIVEVDFEQDTFAEFHSQLRQARSPRLGVGALESWHELQGVEGKAQTRYLFQSANPYEDIVGHDSPTLKGVLELEAVVQASPQDHEAWFHLGLKQQENEREDQAILALAKAVQLDPDHRPTYLALAVSYTNEGDQGAANVMLEKWIDLQEGAMALVRRDGETLSQERDRLIQRLIGLARQSPDEVDPDIQVALGVLFNSSEDYAKAEDCFQAALSVRPDDWILYNRLGATLANSGRSNEAISYYHKALSLHPNFVRALFNLGIAHVNLAQYAQAAQRILDALRLQHADATEAYSGSSLQKGIGSNVLWSTLRNVCMHMGRQDYVELASRRDLDGFPSVVEASLGS